MCVNGEYAQVYEAVDGLLEKCEQILENEKVSLKEYMEILEAGICRDPIRCLHPHWIRWFWAI